MEVAAGGRAALERLKTTRYDLVIADLHMPELDGPDFYHAAVAQRRELADRFLFLTGARPDPEASRFLASTHVRMLARPFTPEGLLHAVALMSP